MKRWAVLDSETVSFCDLKAAGAFRYAQDPTTDALCWAFEEQDRSKGLWAPGMPPGRLALLAADPEVIFVAHNVMFDRSIWREIMVKVYGFPDVPNERWHDTMAMCAMKVLPLDLDRAMRSLDLPSFKDKEGSKLTIGLSRPGTRTTKNGNQTEGMLPLQTPDVLQRVYDYCVTDITGTVNLHRRLGWMPPGEREVWEQDQEINERGIYLDLDYVRSAIELIEKTRGRYVAEFSEITGGIDLTQGVKLKAWCAQHGVFLENMQKEYLARVLGSSPDEDDIDDDLEQYGATGGQELPGTVRRALEIRQLLSSASISKLPRMLSCVCADGRVRGTTQYHGAGTGRDAGRLFQPHNFPRGTLKFGKEAPDPELLVSAIRTADPDYVDAVLGPPIEAVISGLRHTIIAAPGRRLGVGDFAGIEARMVLAGAGQSDKTDLMAAGADVYIDMAQDIYKRPLNKKENVAERQVGKNSVLGLGFQMGADKFHRRYCAEQPLEFAQGVVQTYRKTWAPKVPHLWYALDTASMRAVWDGGVHEAYHEDEDGDRTYYNTFFQLENGWLTMLLPSGRKLWYWAPRQERKAMPWDPTDIRRGWSFEATKLGQTRRVHAFGGLLAENYASGLARDLLMRARKRCKVEGLDVVLTVHDEIIAELRPHQPLSLLEEIMTDRPQWAIDIGVPVAVECWEGQRYKK